MKKQSIFVLLFALVCVFIGLYNLKHGLEILFRFIKNENAEEEFFRDEMRDLREEVEELKRKDKPNE